MERGARGFLQCAVAETVEVGREWLDTWEKTHVVCGGHDESFWLKFPRKGAMNLGNVDNVVDPAN